MRFFDPTGELMSCVPVRIGELRICDVWFVVHFALIRIVSGLLRDIRPITDATPWGMIEFKTELSHTLRGNVNWTAHMCMISMAEGGMPLNLLTVWGLTPGRAMYLFEGEDRDKSKASCYLGHTYEFLFHQRRRTKPIARDLT